MVIVIDVTEEKIKRKTKYGDVKGLVKEVFGKRVSIEDLSNFRIGLTYSWNRYFAKVDVLGNEMVLRDSKY